jgi:cytochrome c oxidase subunit 4
MSDEKTHLGHYSTYAKVLVVLLLLTALNILIGTIFHGSWIAGIIVLISTIQAAITLTWFMHLKWEETFLRIFVAAAFLLFAVVIILTFFDYKFR